jgi:hypothetical protein
LLFASASSPFSQTNQHLIQEMKLELESEYLPQSSAEIKNALSALPLKYL